MNDALDLALLLPADEAPSKPYRSSPYTVREYAALPYAQRRAVDAACDRAAGLVYSLHSHPAGQPYRLGRLPHAPLRHAR